MDPDRVALVQGLFAVMTEKAEVFHELSVEGHAPHLSARSWRHVANKVRRSACAINDLASAAACLIEDDDPERLVDDSDDRSARREGKADF